MSSANPCYCFSFSSQSSLTHSLKRWRFGLQAPIASSFRPRSRSRRRHNKNKKLTIPTTKTSQEPKFETVIDLNQLQTQASSTFRTLFPSFDLSVREFVSSGKEAYRDLQTLVTFDENRKVVISCRPSTVHFIGTTAILSLVTVFAFRVLTKLVSGFWHWGRNSSGHAPMVRRDRSLGGKEVIVGWSNKERGNAGYNLSVSGNPLSLAQGPATGISKKGTKNRVRFQEKLPKWWPTLAEHAPYTEDEEFKREAYRVVRAIKDTRMSGKDIMEDDIIKLRQICRISGVQVSIEPTNIRDSLYRASVNFILNICNRAPSYSTSIEINGEDARQFVAGFAENIGLENVRAATIVSAAVAACTRSSFLQAWAANSLSRKGEEGELSMLSKPYWSEADEIQQEIMVDPHYSKVVPALRNDPDSQIGFSLVQDRLFYKGRLVISKNSKWVPIFLHEFHSSPMGGHSGVLQTYKRLAANLYWPGMMNSVLQFVKDCTVCQQSKYEGKSPAGLLQPLPIPKAIWEDISLDFISGLPKSRGFDAIMVVVDRLTKYGHFICLKHPFTAQTVAALFAKEIGRLHGVPSSIVSDRDPTFGSTGSTPFELVQGRKPRTILRFLPGECLVEAVANDLSNRDEILKQLQFNLQKAQQVMCFYANKKCRDINFGVGDW
ncbi:hypothetical protein L6164_013455 [Bauhinia variegata]|uniref:Uncharacterized protein n=1 Tax=Bauhinia variegata TaxID=167791 RepID=A0ACB9NFE9_BAUVA|nr:hypothetical protein L6164_013455 [Bauhinia variegata]